MYDDFITFEDIQKEKEKYAKILAEGSQNLEKLLKIIFDRKIATIGCCKGHLDDDNITIFPYISFENNKKNDIAKFISIINFENAHVSISKKALALHCASVAKSEPFFEKIAAIANTNLSNEDYYNLIDLNAYDDFLESISLFKQDGNFKVITVFKNNFDNQNHHTKFLNDIKLNNFTLDIKIGNDNAKGFGFEVSKLEEVPLKLSEISKIYNHTKFTEFKK